MEELTITVKIAERPYRLKVKQSEEELIREAVKDIEERITAYAEQYAYKDMQDLLAMVTLQYASSSLHYEKESVYKDNHLMDKLQEINKVLSENMA